MPAMQTRGRVSPARSCALRVVRRVFEEDAYADRAFAAEAAGLQARDRALAMALSYGTVQRRATLDHVAAAALDRPLGQLDAAVLAVLRLGLYELLYLGGSARHATVNEGVELAKRVSPRAAGLVNAVLRRAAREGPGMLARLDDSTPEGAALRHSVPGWLAGQWWRELGGEMARELLRVVNEPAESALRVNSLAAAPTDVAATLPVPSRPAAGLPEGLVLEGPFDVQASELWRAGAIQPQSRASMLVSRILAPRPGQRVLDLCAAPGGKTTHLAALMENRGEIVAVERHPGRAAALERTVTRMRTSCVRVEVGDAAAGRADGPFDCVLVDPPCSGLGTLQSRPDLRWRARPEAIGELASLQTEILAAGAGALAPGGTLVYSVCTISRAEGRDVVQRFLTGHPEFDDEQGRRDGLEMLGVRSGAGVQLLPHRDGTDGFFIARLRRR
ncbi:MAG: 16S rRNA (cytosine(967)-C(5))-methyltransferase RsmB [Solirubrobacterales bacterium]|nr:16S rRNA (cytosine(967)-C(5))-methyltransferase RsmB [Solirubrobacterales bacterium]